MQCLLNFMQKMSVRTQFDTSVQRLIVSDSGEVVGVVARQYGVDKAIRAHQGVILAAGGFIFNDEMVATHAPQLIGHHKVGTDGDDGRAIRMAQAVGAAVRHMGSGFASYNVQSPLLVRSMLLDEHGSRFLSEDDYFVRIGQTALFCYNSQTILLFDQQVYEDVYERGAVADRPPTIAPSFICSTVEELASELGIDPRVLSQNVDFYNHFALLGQDPLFRKHSEYLKPLVAPFAAIDFRNAQQGVFTLGGLQTNTSGQVKNVNGEPIPGLYAAGRTTSGIPNWGYLSGSSLGDGSFFGRRAGLAASQNRKLVRSGISQRATPSDSTA